MHDDSQRECQDDPSRRGDSPPSAAEVPSDTHPRYHPGHPWYYLPEGDNRPPLSVDQISSAGGKDAHVVADLPKDATKREHQLRGLLGSEQAALAERVARYHDIVTRGADALNAYDRVIAYGGNLELARASSLALLFNHIVRHQRRIAWLQNELDSYGPLLF